MRAELETTGRAVIGSEREQRHAKLRASGHEGGLARHGPQQERHGRHERNEDEKIEHREGPCGRLLMDKKHEEEERHGTGSE